LASKAIIFTISLLVLIELFLWVLRPKRYERYWLKISDFALMGAVDAKFLVEGVVPHQPFFFSEN